MNIKDIIRAWRDKVYYDSLSEEQRALVPEIPVGELLSEEELASATGGLRVFGDTCGCHDDTIPDCRVQSGC